MAELKLIPLEEVPERQRENKWESIIKEIPEGMAAVFGEGEKTPSRETFRKLRAAGKLTEDFTYQRINETVYITHHKPVHINPLE